ncbi:MAG: ROK family transcriptional regulator [Bacteroidales bacterium]|nr:ROK family transcriptional regulator [Bacteroidales bacterium]
MHLDGLSIVETLKNDSIKQKIITLFIDKGALPIADITKEIGLSVPTVTKILGELKDINLVSPVEKTKETRTWNATLYNLNPKAGYFIGVDIKHNKVIITRTDFLGNQISCENYKDFDLWGNPDALNHLHQMIEDFIDRLEVPKSEILAVGFSMPGRINSAKGISYNFFYDPAKPFAQAMSDKLEIPVYIDNDTRCIGYAEYLLGPSKGKKNVVYVNMSWGIGVALIFNRQIYYGKSGFSGEYGHISVFDNEILCVCGKKGCLETETSGLAIHRKFIKALDEGSCSIITNSIKDKSKISLNDIIDAAKNEDVLAIDIIQGVASQLGKYLAGILNLLNPNVLILGGSIGVMGDYVSFAVKSALMKYSLNYVNNDTDVITAEIGDAGGALGACLITRSKLLGLINLEEEQED